MKAYEEHEARQRKGEASRKRAFTEKRALGATLKEVEQELESESTDSDWLEYVESEEERPTKRARKSTTKVSVASTSTGGKTRSQGRCQGGGCVLDESVCCELRADLKGNPMVIPVRGGVWDRIETRCTWCKKVKQGCDRWIGNCARALSRRRLKDHRVSWRRD